METWCCRATMYALATAVCAQSAAFALDNPVKFESRNGRLDVIITATTSSVDFGGVTTTGWVYDVCRRAWLSNGEMR